MMKNSLNRKQVAGGATISYILILLNALYGIALMPYIISNIGSAEYGVYKTISSLSSAFMVLDLGLGGTVMRYIARFKADHEENRISNFLGMCFVEGIIMSAIVVIGSVFIYFSIDSIYAKGLTVSEILRARQLFVFLAVSVVCHIFENILNGIITGFNQFIIGNGIKLIRLILRLSLMFILLVFFKNSVVLVAIDLLLIIGMIIVEILYIRINLRITIRYASWDWALFVESFKYTILVFATSIVAQVNNNVDNVIIGAIVNSVSVTIYSLGLQIFSMFGELSIAISGVMLPTVTNYLKTDDKQMTNTKQLIIRVGRIQFSLLAAAFVGFVILGKNFIRIWMGSSGHDDIYYLSIILMFPALFELCINVCISILRAKNMLGFRTLTLLLSTGLNLLITVVGTYYWNYYGAALGTSVSFIVGSLITMNLYYRRKFGFNMIKIYLQIFDRIWVCVLFSGLVCYLVTRTLQSDVLVFVVGVVSFFVVYSITMYLYGFNNREKASVQKIVNKLLGKSALLNN